MAEPELEAEAEDVECPLEDETKALNVTDPQSARTFRYIIVRRCQNFHTAQVGRARGLGWGLPVPPGPGVSP